MQSAGAPVTTWEVHMEFLAPGFKPDPVPANVVIWQEKLGIEALSHCVSLTLFTILHFK